MTKKRIWGWVYKSKGEGERREIKDVVSTREHPEKTICAEVQEI